MWCCHWKLTERILEGPKGGRRLQPILLSYQCPRIFRAGSHLGWEMCMPPRRTLSQTVGQAKWLARDNSETNPITIKPETVSHAAEQFSWVPLLCCSLHRCPFPIKSFALSVHVCWAAPHRPTSPVLAQLQDQRKSPESATEMSIV